MNKQAYQKLFVVILAGVLAVALFTYLRRPNVERCVIPAREVPPPVERKFRTAPCEGKQGCFGVRSCGQVVSG